MQPSRNLQSIYLIAAMLLGIVAQLAAGPSLAQEINTDRPGSDYFNFELSTPNPALCAARCSTDSQCLAWTYVKPGFQGPLPRCWLKNSVPAPIAADFAVSGVRGFEYDTDRPGSDYFGFELSSPNPALCAARCSTDSQCLAWTYVKPGFQGPLPRCWLKNSVPAPVAAGFAISGTRTGSPQPIPPTSFAGTWSANDFGTLTLTQADNRASGTYNGNGGGTIDGTVQGPLWQGGWANNDGRRGTFRVELAPNGNSFKGIFETTGFSGVFNGERR